MSVLERAQAQFRERLGGGLRYLDVPEWPDADGNPTRVWFRPSLNLRQQQKILALSAQDKAAAAIAMPLILRALDEDGKPLFRQIELGEIMRGVDPDVVARIVSEMNADELSDDELEKN